MPGCPYFLRFIRSETYDFVAEECSIGDLGQLGAKGVPSSVV